MTELKRNAHIAGLIYVLLVITGMISLVYVPGQIMVNGDSAQTLANLRATLDLFRFGLIAGVTCQVLYILLPLALYRLLKSVDEPKARLMAILAIVSVPIAFVAYSNKFDVLSLLNGSGVLAGIDAAQIDAQILLALASYSNTISLASLFWGLWLLPFGYLVFKSGFLPKILGLFLMAGCFGYVINLIGITLWPAAYAASGISSFISIPSAIGEIGIAFWLLIIGAKEKSLNPTLENPV
jgi:hypothetical protein